MTQPKVDVLNVLHEMQALINKLWKPDWPDEPTAIMIRCDAAIRQLESERRDEEGLAGMITRYLATEEEAIWLRIKAKARAILSRRAEQTK